MKLELSQQIFQESLKYQISSKCFGWESSFSMLTDRQTDGTNPIVAFRNFANAPKKRLKLVYVGSSVVGLFFF
jgi:hypothetical protein